MAENKNLQEKRLRLVKAIQKLFESYLKRQLTIKEREEVRDLVLDENKLLEWTKTIVDFSRSLEEDENGKN